MFQDALTEVRKAGTDADMAIDLRHMKQLIDRNTVAIVGGALRMGVEQLANVYSVTHCGGILSFRSILDFNIQINIIGHLRITTC